MVSKNPQNSENPILGIQDPPISSDFSIKPTKKPDLAKKCICGCNVPILYSKRNCDIPYSTPRENFKNILQAYFKDDMPETIESESKEIDLYDLFHIILEVKRQFGRVSWRKVAKALGVRDSTSGFRRPLRKLYNKRLKVFEGWLSEKGPVSIGCIDTSLVIIILKEFLPKLEKERGESISTVEGVQEINKEIYEVVEKLLVDVESGNFLIKKRKIEEEKKDEPRPIEGPIFVIRSKKSKTSETPQEKPDPALSQPENTPAIPKINPKEALQNLVKNTPKIPKKKDIKNEPPAKDILTPSKEPEKLSKVPNKAKLKSLNPEPPSSELPLVTNPMTEEFRKRDPTSMGYRTDFKRGYLPIEMQEEHEKLEKIHLEKESKSHFIRKKQSAVNIKKSCGVTYVKPTESKQKGVTHEFPPLPPLAYQVGTVERLIPVDERFNYFTLANDVINSIFNKQSLVRITVQRNYSEEDLKNFILGAKPDGEEVFIDDLSELWRVLAKDSFVTIHFYSDSECFLTPCGPSQTGDVKIGILVKKGLCGTKSVKRCLGLADSESDTLNMYATQLRLELYINKSLWKSALKPTQKLLCSFIGELEVYLQKYLVQWNNERNLVHSAKTIKQTSNFFKYSKACDCEVLTPRHPVKGFWEYKTNTRPVISSSCLSCSKSCFSQDLDFQIGLSSVMESKSAPNWFYLINTRDSFSYDLKVMKSYIGSGPDKITKKEYLFHKDDLPSNYKDWDKNLIGDYVKTGVVTYKNCFSHETLLDLEKEALKTEQDFLAGRFLRNTAQPTFGGKGKVKRTKFFFGTRYLWTSSQLAEKQSRIAAGVRVDVSATPSWMLEKIEKPLVESGVVEKQFINSIAMNIYHDGKEGLAQHFDDAVRFKQPIFTVKLDSDSRLSFGSQFYGYLNGAFCIPCPRGAVCVLEEFSYAANSVKHCVRPCDLAGRSITIILRQIHPFIMEEAKRFDEEVDLPTWFSTLSLRDDSTPYHEQKDAETKYLMKGKDLPKAGY